jgi:hypothetical protein
MICYRSIILEYMAFWRGVRSSSAYSAERFSERETEPIPIFRARDDLFAPFWTGIGN